MGDYTRRNRKKIGWEVSKWEEIEEVGGTEGTKKNNKGWQEGRKVKKNEVK